MQGLYCGLGAIFMAGLSLHAEGPYLRSVQGERAMSAFVWRANSFTKSVTVGAEARRCLPVVHDRLLDQCDSDSDEVSLIGGLIPGHWTQFRYIKIRFPTSTQTTPTCHDRVIFDKKDKARHGPSGQLTNAYPCMHAQLIEGRSRVDRRWSLPWLDGQPKLK